VKLVLGDSLFTLHALDVPELVLLCRRHDAPRNAKHLPIPVKLLILSRHKIRQSWNAVQAPCYETSGE
jgi:hypothetical protein